MRVETRQLPEPCARRHDRRLQEPGAGLAERSRERLLDEQRADEIEQQRDEHFVDAAPEMDGGCDRRPQGAERGRADQRSRRESPGRVSGQWSATAAAPSAAERDLAFGADVDDAGAKAEGHARSRPADKASPD